MESGELAISICQRLIDTFTRPITSPSALSILMEEIQQVVGRRGKVFLFGLGREGLMLKGFGVRLHQLGLEAHIVLSSSTPTFKSRDLLVASAGSGGDVITNAICETAKRAQARIVLLTTQPETGPTVPLASVVAHIPAQTMAEDQEGMKNLELLALGSLYEGSLFVLFEMVVYKLARSLKQSPMQIRARHTNLE